MDHQQPPQQQQQQQDWSKWPATQPLSSPLSFEFKKSNHHSNIQSDSEDYSTSESESISSASTTKYSCLLCNHFEYESRTILEHLFNIHKFVIADVNQIANLSSYLEQWKKKLVGKQLNEFTTVIQTQTSKSEPVTNYFLLSDILPEDQDIRRKLQTERINFVLQEQHLERTNPNFTCVCPMCPQIFKGERSSVTQHLFEQHNFNIGLSDNLINLKEFMQLLKSKFDEMQCLYCDKIFKSTSVLKLHMKKKKHCRLNPTNTTYDRFYLLNYLEPGKNWEDLKKSVDHDDDDDNSNNISNNVELLKQAQKENSGTHQITHWDDWTEDSDNGEPEDNAVCLFCENQFENSDLAFEHMDQHHNFNFEKLRKSWSLDYYESMKLLNFIRRQIYQLVCCYCGETHQDKSSLYNHLESNKQHCGVVKENPIWRDAQYLFPTYENDSILRNFEGFDDDENQDYLQAEKEYQSHLIDEMKQNRDDIIKKMNESNIHF